MSDVCTSGHPDVRTFRRPDVRTSGRIEKKRKNICFFVWVIGFSNRFPLHPSRGHPNPTPENVRKRSKTSENARKRPKTLETSETSKNARNFQVRDHAAPILRGVRGGAASRPRPRRGRCRGRGGCGASAWPGGSKKKIGRFRRFRQFRTFQAFSGVFGRFRTFSGVFGRFWTFLVKCFGFVKFSDSPSRTSREVFLRLFGVFVFT